MQMQSIFEKALGIEAPWSVVNVSFDTTAKRLDIQIDFERGSTFRFEQDGVVGHYKAYDTLDKEWRHLNFFQHECHLKARVPRIKTPDGKTHLIMPPWDGVMNGFTLLFEALILQLCKGGMPVHQVCQLVQISDHKIWAILDKYTEQARSLEDYSKVSKIGTDETSLAKGHQYVSLFVDLEKKRTIFVTDGKDSSTLHRFKKDFEEHQGSAESITDVSCDMSPAFIKGVRETLPSAQITFDKFHVLKLINEAVDEVRREEAKTNPLLKGTRFLWLKNDRNLTQSQREQKQGLELSKLNEKVFRALNIRESFQQIYLALSQNDFEVLLKQWYYWATHSKLAPIKKVAKTVKAHWDGILRWKISQINNGILEGLNSVVQAAKRKARGYKAKHFKTIIYLLTGHLDFQSINPNCVPT
jgi:transposase